MGAQTTSLLPQSTLSSTYNTSASLSKASAALSGIGSQAHDYNNFSDLWQQMSHGLLLKKKEQHLQHQLMFQQQQMQQQQQHHHSFPSPITPTYDKKSNFTSSCRYDSSGGSNHSAEVSSTSSLHSSPLLLTSTSTSSSSSSSTSSATSNNRSHSFGNNYPFSEFSYGSGTGANCSTTAPSGAPYNFLSSNYAAAAAAALGTHHDLSRSSSHALPSPTIYPPTPPPSAPWIHPSWFGPEPGFMKTPKSMNPFEI